MKIQVYWVCYLSFVFIHLSANLQGVLYFIALPWYMWKNSGNPSFPWKLKLVSAADHLSQSYDVLSRDLGENTRSLKILLVAAQPL